MNTMYRKILREERTERWMTRFAWLVLAAFGLFLMVGCATAPRTCTTTAERWGIGALAVLEAATSQGNSSWNGDLGAPCPP